MLWLFWWWIKWVWCYKEHVDNCDKISALDKKADDNINVDNDNVDDDFDEIDDDHQNDYFDNIGNEYDNIDVA